MRTDEAVKRFGSQSALAEALTAAGYEISQPSVSLWKKYPPDRRQLQIEKITDRELKAEPGCKDRVLGLVPARKAGVR